MEARQRSLDDSCKRRLKRIRIKESEKHFQFALQQKGTTFKLYVLKFVLLLILLGISLMILSSSTIFRHENITWAVSRSHFVDRWINGRSDHRYISHLEINWDQISKVLEHLPEKSTIRGVGILNFNSKEITQLKRFIPNANYRTLQLDYIDENVTWESLFPEWIDEEQEQEVPNCPDLPRIKVPTQRLDLIAVKLPCKNDSNWSRDIARLHLQIAAAHLAASAKGSHPIHLLFVTNFFPIPNLFLCKELVTRDGNAWLYKPDLNVLREKLQLPEGSCELALPLGDGESGCSVKKNREAYATVLLSSKHYVCGAIAAAQSIRMTGSTRDLVILVDKTITENQKRGLEMAGWKVRIIERIRNPKAERKAYNEWNYSKFRLWQLIDYEKIIFIDADLIILRNIDSLFRLPEVSAVGNHRTIFNSGVMVIEPSNCTFKLLMDHINDIESYNGGDQGYLNEVFTWWHRIPRKMNFLKQFLPGDEETTEKEKKIKLFEAEPPVLYVLHYLGYKPWMCFRDYDCNWNVGKLHEFASDSVHRIWWKVHDAMPQALQSYCVLTSKQRAQLEYDRKQAEIRNYSDGHWIIEVKDPRKNCNDKLCDVDWHSMLWIWGDQE